MGFISNAILGFCTGVCVIAGLNFFQKKRSKSRMERAVDLAALSRATAEDLRKLIPKEFFPTWIQFPEFERVNWLNKELKEIWPYINKAASTVLRESLEPVLDQYRPAVFSSLSFQKLTLGTIAPQFGGVKIVESQPDEIVLEIDFKWGGNPSIILAVQTYLGVSLPVQVKDVSFFGVIRVAFTPLVDTLPCFGAITVALSQKPTIDFMLNIVGGEVTSIPGLSSTIDGLIRTAVTDSLLWPMRHVIPIVPGDYKYLELHPVAQLDVKLVEARELLNLELIGKSDPFAIIFVRPIPSRMTKSRTKRGTLNPVWNETLSLVVEDLATQRLVVSVMHEGELQQSRLIGQAALQLTDLEPGVMRDTWLPLVKDVDEPKADNKARGKVHLEVIYRLLGEDGQPVGSMPLGFSRTALEKELGVPGGSPSLAGSTLGQKERYQRGVLSVRVESARDLVAKDFNGLSDPFVLLQMQLSSTKKRTKVVQKSLNPVWNESFDFLVEDAAHDMLFMEVWDHDLFGKQSLGKVSLTLTRVMRDGEFKDELELSEAEHGKLTVTLKWKALS